MPRSTLRVALTFLMIGSLAAAASLGTMRSFLSIEGLFIVVGGSVANAFLSYPREAVRKAFTTIRHLLTQPESGSERLNDDIKQLIMWSYIVQARDFIGLEKEAAKGEHEPFVRYGLDLVITSYGPDKIRQMMRTVADAEFERNCLPVTVLRNMGATAPAFGMVGTLVGMTMLFQHMGSDMSNIGSGLAIAMLSTLYGILVARLVCLPAADKLLRKEELERFRHYMLTEGLVMLSAKESPFYMQDRLNSFLEPSRQFALDNYNHLTFHRQFAAAA